MLFAIPWEIYAWGPVRHRRVWAKIINRITPYDAIKTCKDKWFRELQIMVKKSMTHVDGVGLKLRRDLEKSDAENCFLEVL
jgi:hypothetical protein